MPTGYLAAFAAGLLVGYALADRDTDDQDRIEAFLEDRIDETRDKYASTEVDDEDWLADELLLLQSPETERIIRHAVDVDGVGPETALTIARHFDGEYSAYRQASVEELQRVNGVGENRAAALVA